MAIGCCLLHATFADDEKPVFPGQDWERITKPETAEFSSAKLDVLQAWLKTQQTTAMMVVVGGRVLFQYGDVSILASVRKSVLGMLYGKYVAHGTINLEKTVKELGLDDVQKFLPVEEKARLEWLLMSRSGIYHPDSGDTDPTGLCPVRGSQFEKLTGKNIYDPFAPDRDAGLRPRRAKKGPDDAVFDASDLPYVPFHPRYGGARALDVARWELEWKGNSSIPTG